jgi:hypothetical protein
MAFVIWRIALVASLGIFSARAATTITTTNHYAYGANSGWINARADTGNGAVIGEYVCFGYLYSGNVGWICLGNGAPTNEIQYQNISAEDYGVNNDGNGNLRGYAYGANIGWIAFENTGAPKVDLLTGNLSGYAWSANCGWISLSNEAAFVQTDAIQQGILASNGLPVAWLLQNFGTTNVVATADADADGQSNAEEYIAGTNPNANASVLKITSFTRGIPTPSYTLITWNSVPNRFYVIQERASLMTGAWNDYIDLPIAGLKSVGFDDFNFANEFFRIRAYRPLTP